MRRIYACGQPANDLSRGRMDESSFHLDYISDPQSGDCAMNWLRQRRASSKSNVHACRPQHDVLALKIRAVLWPGARQLILYSIYGPKINEIGVASTLCAHQAQRLSSARHGHVEKSSFIFFIPAPVGAVHHDDVVKLQTLGSMCSHQLDGAVAAIPPHFASSFVEKVQRFGCGNDVCLQRGGDVIDDV